MRTALATRIARGLICAASVYAGLAGAAVVSGSVTDASDQRPLAGATVMVQGTAASAPTAADGRYRLDAGGHELGVRQITAWKEGYVIGATMAKDSRADIRLERLPPDDPDYAFKPAATCGGCHTDIHAQWRNTSMGRAMGEKLPQKMSFYLGQTTEGKFDGLGFGWRFFAPMMGISQGMQAMNLDHFAGTCTNCHARGVTWKKGILEPHKAYDAETGRVFVDGALKVFRMDQVAALPVDDGSEGITCDVCHSVEDVRIHHDGKGRLRTVEIDRMEIIRRGDVKFGSFKDAVSPFHKTAYSPIFRKSEFCAMCHMERADDLEGVRVPSMMTLDEYPVWKANFDAGKTDRQCQDCHMYTGGRGAWQAPKLANIGVERDPQALSGHHWRGSYFDGEMARRASNLGIGAERDGNTLVVTATVTNVGAAHKFPGGPPFRQALLLVEATDEQGHALASLDVPRADPAQARHANRIIDVGGGYRENGFFAWWELLNRRPFPEMPYVGRIGKVYNASWVTPPFLPMDWMMRWLWIGMLPLVIGLLGWSPWNAMLGRSTVDGAPRKGLFRFNVGTLDRVLRIVGGALVVAFVPLPWGLVGLVPLMSGVLGWCPTYFLIGGLDTCEKDGFFARNVGLVDRLLRIVGGLVLLGLYFFGPRTAWGLVGIVPLVSGLIGWCPTYRLIGNVSTVQRGESAWFSPNLGAGDRWIRAAGGLFLISLVFWGPETPWGALGIVPLFTAIVGWCVPYRMAGLDTRGEVERERPLWRAAWMNLSDAQRSVRMAAGTMMIFVAAVVPVAFAIQLWPVGGFAAERVLYDTRLDYGQADTTVYRFRAPAGTAQVKARLVYLRHWYFMEPIKGPAFWSTDRWKYLLHEVSLAAPADAKGMLWTDAGNHEGSLADMPPVPAQPGASRWVDAAEAKQRVATRDGP
jgi:hypothetical protein